MIKSISYSQTELLNNVYKLHCKQDGIVIDPTYSKGVFYKKTDFTPTHKLDIAPVKEGTERGDCRHLPYERKYADTIIFDPPFIISYGPSLGNGDKNSNKTSNRFGCFKSMPALLHFYEESIKEFNRVLQNDGVVIFKCQDTVSSGKQYITHAKVIEMAERNGFYVQDLAVLLAKNRMTSPKHANQKHMRKFHSYFLILRKVTDMLDFASTDPFRDTASIPFTELKDDVYILSSLVNGRERPWYKDIDDECLRQHMNPKLND